MRIDVRSPAGVSDGKAKGGGGGGFRGLSGRQTLLLVYVIALHVLLLVNQGLGVSAATTARCAPRAGGAIAAGGGELARVTTGAATAGTDGA